jgi:hypothetical protein
MYDHCPIKEENKMLLQRMCSHSVNSSINIQVQVLKHRTAHFAVESCSIEDLTLFCIDYWFIMPITAYFSRRLSLRNEVQNDKWQKHKGQPTIRSYSISEQIYLRSTLLPQLQCEDEELCQKVEVSPMRPCGMVRIDDDWTICRQWNH